MNIEKIHFGGWPDCWRISDGRLEMVIPSQIGPRIMRLGLVGGPNLFWEDPEGRGLRGGDSWRPYGGHRLWHAPEVQPRTYAPDNEPIQLEDHGDFIRLVQSPEPSTGIQKELDLRWEGGGVHVTHRLRNHNLWPVELSPWALSMMDAGGVGILPLPAVGGHEGNLLPMYSLNLWLYSDLSDPRWTFGQQALLLRQEEDSEPLKIGMNSQAGWAGYVNKGQFFLTTFPAHQAGAVYPDRGSSVEFFTNLHFLEVETLGPLAPLGPGETVEHVERWFVFEGLEGLGRHNAAELLAAVGPLVAGVLG
jgi:hypothetical protein